MPCALFLMLATDSSSPVPSGIVTMPWTKVIRHGSLCELKCSARSGMKYCQTKHQLHSTITCC